MPQHGSTTLTPEQQDQVERIFGVRYIAIQQRPEIAGRKERRQRGQRSERRVRTMSVPRG